MYLQFWYIQYSNYSFSHSQIQEQNWLLPKTHALTLLVILKNEKWIDKLEEKEKFIL